MSGSVLKTVLPNGLTVLTKELHDSPVATFWVWYRVGARNEVAGITGISHWVEHMLFKGTPTFKPGDIFRVVTKNGGTLNGFTWLDYTAYFEKLPSDRIEISLQIESDRMANATFDPDEVTSERTVILSERQGSENQPTFLLGEEVNSIAFKAHPYGQGVIGWPSDLKAMTRDDLYGYYRRHYAPNNAVVVAVGDFSTDWMLSAVDRYFGGIPSGPEIAPVRTSEPRQEGERRVLLRRPGPTRYLEMAFHAPAASDPDAVPMIVLDAVLSGAKSMGVSGREGSLGRSSRFYRLLVDGGFASGAGTYFGLTRDPYLFEFAATLRSGVELETVERLVKEELERVRQDGITDDELAKVRKQVRAQLAYGMEGVTSQASWLGSLEMVHSHTFLDELLDRVDSVTQDDVLSAARTYIRPEGATIGWFEPAADTAGGGQAERAESLPAVAPFYYISPKDLPRRASPKIERESLSNGITIVGHESSSTPSVVVRASLHAGGMFDPAGKNGLASFAARMRLRGTGKRGFQQLNELTDGIGATISADASTQITQVTFRCLREDFPLMLDLMAESLREPTYPESEIENLRGEVLTRLREHQNDTASVAEKLFYELAYPEEHPYHHWLLGEEKSVAAFTRDDLHEFQRRLCRPDSLSIAISGAVEFEEAVSQVRRALGDWSAPSSGTVASLSAPEAPRPAGLIRRDVEVPGKSQADIVMGLPALSRKSPDFYALSFADLVIGGLGLMGRLGEIVREKQGLAYHVSSSLESLMGPGAWQVHAGVDPSNVDKAIASTLEQIRAIQEGPIKDEELADGKSYLTGVLPIALETSSGVVRILQQIETYGLGLDYLDRYPEIIQALTKSEIQGAARKYLSADDIVIVVAGPPSA